MLRVSRPKYLFDLLQQLSPSTNDDRPGLIDVSSGVIRHDKTFYRGSVFTNFLIICVGGCNAMNFVISDGVLFHTFLLSLFSDVCYKRMWIQDNTCVMLIEI